MATVTPDERRVLMEFFGLPSEAIDDMSETKAARGLEQYHASGKLAIYDPSPPLPQAADWISDGLARSVTPEGIAYGFSESGKAVAAVARQVGTGIQDAAQKAGLTIKLALLAVVVVGGLILYVKVK